ncbi:hypothetical protein EC968_008540 [Mortierella alpina]|nr:hypothetical protein EC968_008540 [Mortierella alpina]
MQSASSPDPFSSRAYQDSAVEKEIKQRAATALHDHSVLLLHALSMNEVKDSDQSKVEDVPSSHRTDTASS